MFVGKLRILLAGLLISASVASSFAQDQGIRAGYAMYFKTDPAQEKYRMEPNFLLDWNGSESVFYTSDTFYKDSLSAIAFDDNGNIHNREAYAEMFDYRSAASKDVVFIDYANNNIRVDYHVATVYVSGEDKLQYPQWILTGEEDVTKDGMRVKKATAEYYGREWTIWYSEEIPAPIGPWLLWGAPGIIVSAIDSESLFCFKLLRTEQLGGITRYQEIMDYYDSSGSQKPRYKYKLKEAEQVHTKMVRDADYLHAMMGFSDYEGYSVDRDGTRRETQKSFSYIPLIPDSYWQK